MKIKKTIQKKGMKNMGKLIKKTRYFNENG